MGAGYSNGFALLVVLFILLIIVGAKISFTN
ncbi:YjcZ family sporulation protein [Bacillus sp. SL00103]